MKINANTFAAIGHVRDAYSDIFTVTFGYEFVMVMSFKRNCMCPCDLILAAIVPPVFQHCTCAAHK